MTITDALLVAIHRQFPHRRHECSATLKALQLSYRHNAEESHNPPGSPIIPLGLVQVLWMSSQTMNSQSWVN